jgi:hypothetical protein
MCNVCRHYLVIPIEHIPTVKSLQRTEDDHQLGGYRLPSWLLTSYNPVATAFHYV